MESQCVFLLEEGTWFSDVARSLPLQAFDSLKAQVRHLLQLSSGRTHGIFFTAGQQGASALLVPVEIKLLQKDTARRKLVFIFEKRVEEAQRLSSGKRVPAA